MPQPNDMRADLIITLADGYRLSPLSFNIPMGFSFEQTVDIINRRHEVETMRLQTIIAKLERQLDEALKPKPLKWWQKRGKK